MPGTRTLSRSQVEPKWHVRSHFGTDIAGAAASPLAALMRGLTGCRIPSIPARVSHKYTRTGTVICDGSSNTLLHAHPLPPRLPEPPPALLRARAGLGLVTLLYYYPHFDHLYHDSALARFVGL